MCKLHTTHIVMKKGTNNPFLLHFSPIAQSLSCFHIHFFCFLQSPPSYIYAHPHRNRSKSISRRSFSPFLQYSLLRFRGEEYIQHIHDGYNPKSYTYIKNFSSSIFLLLLDSFVLCLCGRITHIIRVYIAALHTTHDIRWCRMSTM